jgi:hypothetical protein
MGVAAGNWNLRASVDASSGYVGVPTTTPVTVESGQTVTQDLEIWPINSVISGQVLAPDDSPVAGVFVYAEGESPFVGPFHTHGSSDAAGNFELVVPQGVYRVGGSLPRNLLDASNWFNPRPIDDVTVSAASPATGLELRFRVRDGRIFGTIGFAAGLSPAAPTQPAYVWAWSEMGEWADTDAAVASANSFTYELMVVRGTRWHVGAIYEDWNNGVYYETVETVVDLTTAAEVSEYLELQGDSATGTGFPLPQPMIVSFDGTQMQTIVLPNGLTIQIPAGALVTSGTVTLFIYPVQEVRPEPGRRILGLGYRFVAIDQNGMEALEQEGIAETRLVPVYYSTLFGHWIPVAGYVLDTVNNEITFQIDRWGTFGLMSAIAPDTDSDGVIDAIDPDDDNDGLDDGLDCAPLDDQNWSAPSAARDLAVSPAPVDNLTWAVPVQPGCVTPRYDVLRSLDPSSFMAAGCIESDDFDLLASDSGDPGAGQVFFYLVRVENACGSAMGQHWNGTPREGGACP